ncbi:hypothetical protein Pint_21899 [Pistacia integerrima]|uniref:Uncharacterized protein n=1 Tax=Pistacia integerrima TaxID=434235 RepID=A0ACC0XAM1_9ROSI|nr:hypothetical protein Pint_21899 [Pistacia integerrima]
MMENVQVGSPQVANGVVPVPPPLPGPTTSFINTDYDGIIYGHANILGIASPAMRGILKQSKCHGCWRSLSICGVSPNA